jgi:CheY-like chemotaxis protein
MSKKILLVDDDTDDTELFLESIREIDDSVVCHCAPNGREALHRLKEIDSPDLIFLDINMPIMDGWQCLARLKSHDDLKHIPVIMYSTSSHQKDIDKAFEMGAVCFFVKPYDFKELKTALSAIVANLEGDPIKSIRGLTTKSLVCPDVDLSHSQ